jgi:glycine/D-amino acid oxidase-like deaminating enzyme
MRTQRVAILGGGMLGVCAALELAHRGQRVVLVEGANDLLEGAGRWNEGKIHLGFLYAGDPSLSTARRLIPGGLAFADVIERLIGRGIRDLATTEDDLFLVHRKSVVDASAYAMYADRTADLIRHFAGHTGAGKYLADVNLAESRRLSASELAEVTTSDDVVAGFAVPERSVSTLAVADLLKAAVLSEPLIEVRVGAWVDKVRKRDDGRLDVVCTGDRSVGLEAFDVVVNGLWESRLVVDASIGIHPPAPWTHRFRATVYGHAPKATFRSAVLCTGPFGGVNRYGDGRVYLSWYEVELLAEGNALEPPRREAALTDERRAKVGAATIRELSRFFPGVADVTDFEVHGGWVYAVGNGSLADPASTLHQRDKFGIVRDGGYISVDTAKYSLAPWIAMRVADMVDA